VSEAGDAAVAGRAGARARRRWFFGWYIVAAGATNNFVVFGLTIWGFGIFIEPLREEFGWSTAAIAGGFSIRSLEQGFLAPFVGVLIDRFGPRVMLVAGTLILAAGLGVFAAVQSLELYYVASLLVALGQSVGSFTAYSAAVMRWFVRKRGRAMGLMNAGNGAGYLLVPLIALVVTHGGWRWAMAAGAVLLLVVALPLALFVRDAPEQLGLRPDGDEAGDAPGEEGALPGSSVREALRVPAFYLLVAAQAGGGALISGWTVHTIPHLRDGGFSLGGATAVGVGYALLQIGFRPAAGLLGDRVGRLRMLVVAYALLAMGMVVFAFVTRERLLLLPLYYATFAFGQAAWSVLQIALVADLFGPRRFGTIFGLLGIMQMPAGLLSPVLAGAWFDAHGTYVPVFVAYAVCALVGAVSLALVRRPPLGVA
jgi:sugar phosphate permease